ncbi:unnamed protein product [Arabidopsis lyrata]|nr:unnamed protein product [Arabidopsis lyrata]
MNLSFVSSGISSLIYRLQHNWERYVLGHKPWKNNFVNSLKIQGSNSN